MAGGKDPYTLNAGAAAAGAALFGISAAYHTYQMIKKKTWFYLAMVSGSWMMTIGYVFRFLSAQTPDNTLYSIGQSLFILLPPSLYAATIYMIYGRIVLFVNAPEASMIRPTRTTKIFVIGDVLSFLVQLGGGGMMASASKRDLGQKILLIGLAIQLIVFGFFLYIAIIFQRRMRKSSSRHTIPLYGKHGWHKLLLLTLAAAGLIIGRCVFRLIEFGMGDSGVLMQREIFVYLGDTAPMFLVQVMFHVVHAGDVFPAKKADSMRVKDVENGSYINLAKQVSV